MRGGRKTSCACDGDLMDRACDCKDPALAVDMSPLLGHLMMSGVAIISRTARLSPCGRYFIGWFSGSPSVDSENLRLGHVLHRLPMTSSTLPSTVPMTSSLLEHPSPIHPAIVFKQDYSRKDTFRVRDRVRDIQVRETGIDARVISSLTHSSPWWRSLAE